MTNKTNDERYRESLADYAASNELAREQHQQWLAVVKEEQVFQVEVIKRLDLILAAVSNDYANPPRRVPSA